MYSYWHHSSQLLKNYNTQHRNNERKNKHKERRYYKILPKVLLLYLHIYIYTKQNYFHTDQFICYLELSVSMTHIYNKELGVCVSRRHCMYIVCMYVYTFMYVCFYPFFFSLQKKWTNFCILSCKNRKQKCFLCPPPPPTTNGTYPSEQLS